MKFLKLEEFWLTSDKYICAQIENIDIWGEISRKLHVGFPPNAVYKTLKILTTSVIIVIFLFKGALRDILHFQSFKDL